MAKTTVSSVELAAIVEELQLLSGAKISRVYDYGEKALLLELHLREQGKKLLRVIPGKFLNLTAAKESPLQPSGFCQQLRKYLDGAILQKIRQQESERIVLFEVDGLGEARGKKYLLIMEFFSKGNVILTDENEKIITCLERQTWKDRTIKPGEKYLFPPSPINWKAVTEAQLYELLQKSNKKSIIISLATELGAGGLYAEEICKRAEIEKEKLPKEVSFAEAGRLLKEIKKISDSIKKPKGYFYQEEITPFPLQGREAKEIYNSYNQALDTIEPFQKESPYQKKIEQLQKTIINQEESMKKQEDEIKENTEKGEFMYENYAFFDALLKRVKETIPKGWDAVKEMLGKISEVKKVDGKEKKILLEIRN